MNSEQKKCRLDDSEYVLLLQSKFDNLIILSNSGFPIFLICKSQGILPGVSKNEVNGKYVERKVN